ncbi:YihY/virulence factor BrkB family protein [Silvanigrella aquatica]|uniref:YihY/virulence factor BrkB family protein n=1 Tax=Silvanigrella aquatica TaxID=1915309 RepID=UPI001E5B52B4|nr:YihY/virulence factor BrkB family protein [Silvanigrella aquatica]
MINRETIHILFNNKIFEKSAQLTYISILSIVPLLAIIFTFIHAINGFNSLFTKVIEPLIMKHFGSNAGTEITNYLQAIILNLELKELGVISFLTFLFTVVLLVFNIEDTIDEIMEFKNKMTMFNRISKCWLIITVTPFLFTVALVQSDSFLKLFTLYEFKIFDSFTIKIIREIIGWTFQWLFFIFLFYIIPSNKVRFKSALWGGLAANILFEILQYVNLLIAKRTLSTDPSHIYGSVPIIAVLFFAWIRLIWVIILVGASYTISTQKILYHKEYKTLKIFPSKGFIDCLGVYNSIKNLYKRQNIPSTEFSIIKETKINRHEVEGWLRYLISKKIICLLNNDLKNPLYIPTYQSIKEEQNEDSFLKNLLLEDSQHHNPEYQHILEVLQSEKK